MPLGVLGTARIPGTSRPDVTVVLVQCLWEDGTGWGSVLSYSTAKAGPKLLQVVLSLREGWTPTGAPAGGSVIAVRRGGFAIHVAGAKGNAPRCCLNVFATLSWQWKDGRFEEVGQQPKHDPGA
ncbi:MAG TPA: hypothetical protein VFN61_14685 [Acidimicrobiales bacterium]|nr:hypothetical protein [Acidimicrobiales bacterium]